MAKKAVIKKKTKPVKSVIPSVRRPGRPKKAKEETIPVAEAPIPIKPLSFDPIELQVAGRKVVWELDTITRTLQCRVEARGKEWKEIGLFPTSLTTKEDRYRLVSLAFDVCVAASKNDTKDLRESSLPASIRSYLS